METSPVATLHLTSSVLSKLFPEMLSNQRDRLPQLYQPWHSECLGEEVSSHEARLEISHLEYLFLAVIHDELETYSDVFCSFCSFFTFCLLDRSLIVNMRQHRL